MLFDPENEIVKLCAAGMSEEASDTAKAKQLFEQAWQQTGNDLERFIAAHYLARAQSDAEHKLQWDITALEHALKVDDNEMKATYPSLYLNIGKGYENAGNNIEAAINYHIAKDFSEYLLPDGYGDMIKRGIEAGLQRVKAE